jgi:hypothetical protein
MPWRGFDKQKTIWAIRKGFDFWYVECPNTVQNWSTNILALTTKPVQLDTTALQETR